MLQFALKNMAIKKIQTVLVILSIVISAGVGVLAYNIGEQVSDGITGNAAYYSAIIGPAGSETQLAMNTMYFTDSPLGTIPYAIVSELKRDNRVTSVIPFAMADSYNGFSCVGTTGEYLSGKKLASGSLFDDSGCFEVVVGSAVADICNLHLGEEIYTSHSVGDEHHTPLKVVGILERSHSSFDNVVFTQLKTIWKVHQEEEGEDAAAEESNASHDAATTKESSASHDTAAVEESSASHDTPAAEGSSDSHDAKEHEGHTSNAVCAILLKATNPGTAMRIVTEYNGKIFTDADGDTFALQAIEPMNTVRGVLEDTDTTKYIVFVLCAIILIMNVIIISIITLLNMYHSAKEIALMRLIGISMQKINLIYLIQNGLIGLLSILLAFGLSRLCLLLAGKYVSGMGVVLNIAKVYPLEWVILAAVFLISVLPTMICTFTMSRRDSMEE